jgi:hypothetical protein
MKLGVTQRVQDEYSNTNGCFEFLIESGLSRTLGGASLSSKPYSPSASKFQASSRSSGTYFRSLFFLTQSLSGCEHK